MSLSLLSTSSYAFNAPAFTAPAAAKVRFNTPLMEEDSWGAETAIPPPPTAVDTAKMEGVVVPTGGAVPAPPEGAAKEGVDVDDFLKMGDFGPPRFATWNPKQLGVPPLPAQAELFTKQFVPEYLKVTPDYLDGTLPGDIGFDPWGLTVLANPPLDPSALQKIDAKSRTAAERNEQMLALSTEEQRAKLLWMRSSELKHGRLAMLAVAGWPMVELFRSKFLHNDYTNGRAPSLFNGHLFDYAPFLFVCLGGFAALEFFTKDNKDGDYGFDPLGFASGIGAMRTLQVAEVKHGRAAMMAITGFAVQECIYGTPVVEQTPFFFLPLGGFTG